jgi:hypothetical protein
MSRPLPVPAKRRRARAAAPTSIPAREPPDVRGGRQADLLVGYHGSRPGPCEGRDGNGETGSNVDSGTGWLVGCLEELRAAEATRAEANSIRAAAPEGEPTP